MNKVVEPVATATLVEDGGFAFANSHPNWGSSGMSLRDYFAAQAMDGWLASSVEAKWIDVVEQSGAAENIAKLAYRIADAMLAERSKATSSSSDVRSGS